MSHELIDVALSQKGIKEVKGKFKHNKHIVDYFHEIGHDWVNDDETPWCSAFLNWVCMKAGYERTNKLNARSWLDIGILVGNQPKQGDIVILWRGNKTGAFGHVGFFMSQDKENVYILGGNQSDKVCIKPYSNDRILGFRRLSKVDENG